MESASSLLKRRSLERGTRFLRYISRHLDEMCFRFNNRKNQFLFRDTLIKLILSPNLEYKQLTAKIEDAA